MLSNNLLNSADSNVGNGIIDLVKELKPKKTILTNLHISLDYFTLKKRLPKHIIPAYDGISFKF